MELTPFLLRVETLTGYNFEVVARPIDSIENIKARIAFQEGLGLRQFHLVHESRELRDDETVGSLGFCDGSRVTLVLSLKGGPVATKRVHLPPIGRPATKEWNDEEDDPDYEEEYSIISSMLEPSGLETALETNNRNKFIIYQNGEKTFLFHVDNQASNHSLGSLAYRRDSDKKGKRRNYDSNGNNGRPSTNLNEDMSDRVKENVTIMKKIQGLKGRISDQKPSKSTRAATNTVRRIQAEVKAKSINALPGQPPYNHQQLAKYVRAKIREEAGSGNPLLLPSVILRPAQLKSGDRTRPLSAKSRALTARKKKLRCAECRKKLGPTTSFPCHCGLVFCPMHRNAEAHNCSFDYKAEGKRILKDANPVIVGNRVQPF